MKTPARLVALEIERFKSYEASTRLPLAPLTILLGRNNSGKSTLIQALLLLKQTLASPRSDLPLHFEGPVDALGLSELTWGWPRAASFDGPRLSVRWRGEVDVQQALNLAKSPNLDELRQRAGLDWLTEAHTQRPLELEVELTLDTIEHEGSVSFRRIDLSAHVGSPDGAVNLHRASIRPTAGSDKWRFWWEDDEANKLGVELDHFIPYLTIERRHLGPRHRQRSHYNGYLLLFAQPLEQLRALLDDFQYLGANRPLPSSLYRPASAPPRELGVSGEYAAQLIHARRHDIVHYLRPLSVEGDHLRVDDTLQRASFSEAINDILAALDVRARLRIEDIESVGFRLLFGDAPLTQVGRGLAFLLPMIELGLFADPLRFQASPEFASLQGYLDQCARQVPLALEEPEAHLHPKIQTRLAHWFVMLARSGRQVFVETHSDHLVRRLRGLVARAEPNSSMERWLLENVVILEVEQDDQGRSHITESKLTREGGLAEHWPADFMDEASQEESDIYYAGLDKQEHEAPSTPVIHHDEGEEPQI